MTLLPRRSVRKQRGSNGNSVIYSRGISTSGCVAGLASVSPGSGSAGCWRSSFWLPLAPGFQDARSGRLCLLADALPSALWA